MTQSAVVRWSSPEAILVATNFLEGQSLLLHANDQARLSHAKLLLVHVIPHFGLKGDVHDSKPCIFPGETVRAIKAKLDEASKDFQREGVMCEPIILTGRPAEQISLLAQLRNVDRVIVGTRYVSGVARLVQPSVAEELMATLEVPICIIGRRTQPRVAFRNSLNNVLVATSLHRRNPPLVSFASALAEINDSRLTVLHVLDTKGIDDQEEEFARRAAWQQLSSLIPDPARHKYQPLLLIREGDPAKIILHEAGLLSQGVLILGSSNVSITPRLLTNSIVRRVLDESQCPVITVRSSPTVSSEDTEAPTTRELSAHTSDAARLPSQAG